MRFSEEIDLNPELLKCLDSHEDNDDKKDRFDHRRGSRVKGRTGTLETKYPGRIKEGLFGHYVSRPGKTAAKQQVENGNDDIDYPAHLGVHGIPNHRHSDMAVFCGAVGATPEHTDANHHQGSFVYPGSRPVKAIAHDDLKNTDNDCGKKEPADDVANLDHPYIQTGHWLSIDGPGNSP